MREIASKIKNIVSDLSSDLMVVIKDDDPKKRDELTARIEKFLYKIRNNEDISTFIHRRDEPGRTTMMIGLDEHDERDAIIKAIYTRAEKEAGDIEIFTKDMKEITMDKVASKLIRIARKLLD